MYLSTARSVSESVGLDQVRLDIQQFLGQSCVALLGELELVLGGCDVPVENLDLGVELAELALKRFRLVVQDRDRALEGLGLVVGALDPALNLLAFLLDAAKAFLGIGGGGNGNDREAKDECRYDARESKALVLPLLLCGSHI